MRGHYHGALPHGFQNTFGINRAGHDCGSRMDGKHRHSILFVRQPREEYDGDASLLRFVCRATKVFVNPEDAGKIPKPRGWRDFGGVAGRRKVLANPGLHGDLRGVSGALKRR